MEDEFKDALQRKTKFQVIEYAMQVRFERDFLQARLNNYEDFIPPFPDANVQVIRQKIHPDEMGEVLEDFINFVNDRKGYKIGVGQALIERYLDYIYGRKIDE